MLPTDRLPDIDLIRTNAVGLPCHNLVALPAPPDTHLDLLERPLFAAWATLDNHGGPLVNPMWFLWDHAHEVIRLTHTTKRANYANVRRDERVALLIWDPDDPYRYIQIRGVVQSIDADPTGSLHEALQDRYRGFVSDVSDRRSRVVISVRPVAYKVRDN
jgi:PPOX class probable F420-dependent enzyme